MVANEVLLNEPYQLLWRQYHALKSFCEDVSNPSDSRTHVKVLLDFLESCPEMPNASELVTLCDPTRIVESISYASLWLLFTPSTLVVPQTMPLSEWEVYLVDSVRPPTKEIDRKGHYVYKNQTLVVNCVGYNGTRFEFQRLVISLDHFLGVSPLAELRHIPLRLAKEYEKKMDMLLARGRKFWDLRGLHMKEFVDRSLSNSSLAVSPPISLLAENLFSGDSDFTSYMDHPAPLLIIHLQENERVMVDWAIHSSLSDERLRLPSEVDNDSTRAMAGYQQEREEADLKVAVKPSTIHQL